MKPRSRVRTAAIAIGTLFGLATGIGGYTFIYARGGSYPPRLRTMKMFISSQQNARLRVPG